MKQMTQKEIASISKVSIATVSRFLENPTNVKTKTRLQIENALRLHKKKLNQVQSKMIGFILPDVENQFFPMLLKGIDKVLSANGYTLIICNSEGIPNNEQKILENLLEINVAGIIMVCSSKSSNELKNLIENDTIPVIFVDRMPSDLLDVSSVTASNDEGMYQSAKYLITLGHKKILYISGPTELSTEQERYKGFLSALRDSNIEGITHTKITAGYNRHEAYDKVSELIKTNKFNFSAICAANDLMMFGAYQALIESNYKIPKDVSIIGYDDIPTSKLLSLSTIRQPFEEMGKNAAIQLLSKIQNPFTPQSNIVLSTSLVIRNSCKAVYE